MTDFHIPGLDRSERASPNAWELFGRNPSQVGRGRAAAVVGLGGYFECGGISFVILFVLFVLTHKAFGMCRAAMPHLPLYYK